MLVNEISLFNKLIIETPTEAPAAESAPEAPAAEAAGKLTSNSSIKNVMESEEEEEELDEALLARLKRPKQAFRIRIIGRPSLATSINGIFRWSCVKVFVILLVIFLN